MTSWSSNYTSYVPSQYYLKASVSKGNISAYYFLDVDYSGVQPWLSGGTVSTTNRYATTIDVGFVPTTISVYAYTHQCNDSSHSGMTRKVKIEGSNDNKNFVDIANGYSNGNENSTTKCYRYYKITTGAGCWTMFGYDFSKITTIGYYSPSAWSATQDKYENLSDVPAVIYEANDSNGRKALRRVYSYDDGATWNVCNGNACPTA